MKKKKFWDKKKIVGSVIGLFLVSLMVTSILSITDRNEEERYDYNEYRFVKTEQGWVTYKDDDQILLLYGPKDLEDINVDFNLNSLRYSQKIYLSLNPRDNVRRALNDFFRYINFNVVNSCYTEKDKYNNIIEECADLPLITCEDSTDEVGVIIFEESEDNEVSLKNNCLYIKGSSIYITEVVDKIVLMELGIL